MRCLSQITSNSTGISYMLTIPGMLDQQLSDLPTGNVIEVQRSVIALRYIKLFENVAQNS